MLLPASVDDNVVTCHSAEHPCGASALRGLTNDYVFMRRGLVEANPRFRRGGQPLPAEVIMFRPAY